MPELRVAPPTPPWISLEGISPASGGGLLLSGMFHGGAVVPPSTPQLTLRAEAPRPFVLSPPN